MEEIKLKPDDVLKGAGSYRDEITLECPACGTEITTEPTQNEATCECGETIELQKPFRH